MRGLDNGNYSFALLVAFVTLYLIHSGRVVLIRNSYFFFYFQHQQQVATAVERAKQVTMTELNAIIGVSVFFM